MGSVLKVLPFGVEAECAESTEHTEPMGSVPSSQAGAVGAGRVSSMGLLGPGWHSQRGGGIALCHRQSPCPLSVHHGRAGAGVACPVGTGLLVAAAPGEAALGSITAWQAAAQERWH